MVRNLPAGSAAPGRRVARVPTLDHRCDRDHPGRRPRLRAHPALRRAPRPPRSSESPWLAAGFVTDDWALRVGSSATVIRTAGPVVLVDPFLAFDDPERLGPRLQALREAGVEADDVDVVVNTHIDGLGVNLLLDGSPTFPRARYLVPRAEIEAHPHRATTPSQSTARSWTCTMPATIEATDGRRGGRARRAPRRCARPQPGTSRRVGGRRGCSRRGGRPSLPAPRPDRLARGGQRRPRPGRSSRRRGVPSWRSASRTTRSWSARCSRPPAPVASSRTARPGGSTPRDRATPRPPAPVRRRAPARSWRRGWPG